MASSRRFRELTPRDHLLLRAAVLPGPRARAAWDEWFADAVLDELPFDEGRLLPRVFANLAASGEADCLPPRLRGLYRWVWTSNQRRCHAVRPALQALVDAGIPTMLVKGGSLLATGRCPWGAREMGDVDILVQPNNAAAAASVLEAAGWVAYSGVTPGFVDRRLVLRRHSWNYARDAPHGNLDLHWHAFEGLRADDIGASLFERARRVNFGDVELMALDDIDHVLHTIEHASHGEPAHRLLWVADTTSLLGDIDGARLARRARTLALHELATDAVDIVADALADSSVRSIGRELARSRASRRERLLARTETGVAFGRTFPRLSELVRTSVVHGVYPRHPRQAAQRVLRRRLEPSLCAHPLLSAGLAMAGRPRRVEFAVLRVLGPLGRPPAPSPLGPGEWVELTTAPGIDRVAGAGWSWPMPEGVWSDGPEARLALDTAIPRGRPLALEVCFGDEAATSPNGRVIVLVNGRAIAEWTFGIGPEHAPEHLPIPAWLGDRCRPLDVVIWPVQPFMPPNRRRGPGDARAAVQLRAVRVIEA